MTWREWITPSFHLCRYTVFAEPQTDVTYDEIPQDADAVFASEYLPGLVDQRAGLRAVHRAADPTGSTAGAHRTGLFTS